MCMSFRWVWHLTCHALVYCFGWLISIARYVFKSPSICFWGTRYDTFTVNVFLSCILYRGAGPGCDRTVCKWVDSYHENHICPPMFFFGDALALLRESSSLVHVNRIVHVSQGFISDESYAFAPFQAKINLKFHVTLRSLIGLFNWFIKSDKSGRQAKIIQHVAGGNFTRAHKFPRGLCLRGNMAALPPLVRSWIHPASYAGYRIAGCIPAFSTRGKGALGPLLSAPAGAGKRETPTSNLTENNDDFNEHIFIIIMSFSLRGK